MKRLVVFAVTILLFSSASFSDDSVIGRIQMIHPYIPQGLVYVHLQGYPQLDGGGCPQTYFVGRMDDSNFKSFVYATLLAAKATDADIKLIVQGCVGVYPQIVSVEYSPRQ